VTSPDLGLTPAQIANARLIVAEGKARGASPLQIRIALMTALTESNLLNYANRNNPESLAIPHEAVGQDHASVGVFQQQVGIWGDTKTLMNVRASAAKFFDALAKAGTPNAAAPWLTAQNVQRSAFPDGSNYRNHWDAAGALYTGLSGTPAAQREIGLDAAAPGMDGPLQSAPTWAGTAAKIGTTLQDPKFWQRAGLFALGGALVLYVLWNVAGGSKVVRAGVKIATKGAV
jgi:hypothetical protein